MNSHLARLLCSFLALLPGTETLGAPSSQHRSPERLIVWNVGQGLWVTLSRLDSCHHFDSGGERAPWKAIRQECAGKTNRTSYSHWDFDHISFARALKLRLKKLCLSHRPAGPTPQNRGKVFLSWPECTPTPSALQTRIQELAPLRLPNRTSLERMNRNDWSRVFIVENEILLPGDSTQKQERHWSKAIQGNRIKILVLGHHGSQTSTSKTLLKKLPNLKQAVASARSSKYGHPHRSVRERLRARGVALVSTEEWGSLHFELK